MYKKEYWTAEEIQEYIDKGVEQVEVEWRAARELTVCGELVYEGMKKSK